MCTHTQAVWKFKAVEYMKQDGCCHFSALETGSWFLKDLESKCLNIKFV